jgi:hypothetical protein
VGQGRDFLGLLVGVPIMAGGVAKGRPWVRQELLRLGSLVIVGLAFCQAVDFYGALRRFTVGVNGPYNAFARVPGGWQPAIPGPLLVVVFAASVAGVAVVLMRPRRAAEATGEPAAGSQSSPLSQAVELRRLPQRLHSPHAPPPSSGDQELGRGPCAPSGTRVLE